MYNFKYETESYYVYENNNRYSKNDCSRKESDMFITTLINSLNCTDCMFCDNCTDCYDCINVKNLHNGVKGIAFRKREYQ